MVFIMALSPHNPMLRAIISRVANNSWERKLIHALRRG